MHELVKRIRDLEAHNDTMIDRELSIRMAMSLPKTITELCGMVDICTFEHGGFDLGDYFDEDDSADIEASSVVSSRVQKKMMLLRCGSDDFRMNIMSVIPSMSDTELDALQNALTEVEQYAENFIEKVVVSP